MLKAIAKVMLHIHQDGARYYRLTEALRNSKNWLEENDNSLAKEGEIKVGSFSWLKADDLTNISNIVYGQPFKCLIPKEFGGGFIKDDYQDYGYLGTKDDSTPKYDMYELLAFWNSDKQYCGHKIREILSFDGEFPSMKEIDEFTNKNRKIGINIGCYDDQISKLKYPLKLVSASYKGAYEDLDKPSYGDPDQGFGRTYRK